MPNPYIPKLTKIIDIGMEKDADDLKSFTLEFPPYTQDLTDMGKNASDGW